MGSQVYLQIYNGNESAKHGSLISDEEWDVKNGPKEPKGNINTKNIENGTHELKTFENNNMLNYLSDENRLINNNIITQKNTETSNNNINNNNNNNINSSYKDGSFVDNGNGDEKEIDTTNLCVYDTREKEIYTKPKLNISLLDSEISSEMYVGEKFSNGQYLGEKSLSKHTKHVPQEKGEGDKQKREKQKRYEKSQSAKYIDVRKIETSMPEIDLEVIESHLKAAKEEEKRRRNEREEIRRRLASGCDTEEISTNRFMKKPSLQTRLQNGMNLQICFMNEASSDTESPSCDSPCKVQSPPKPIANPVPQAKASETSKTVTMRENEKSHLFKPCIDTSDAKGDFFVKQTQLQAEARLALSQAKEKARFQMEADRLSGKDSPVTEILRLSLKKVGFPFSEERRRVSRQLLTDMNVAQLQVIVNDLHSQIEYLNESLVTLLMERDELHMTQDSMLVDIEDVTRYLGAKEDCLPEKINVSSAKENVQAPSFW